MDTLKGTLISDLSIHAKGEGKGVAGIIIDNSGDCQVRNVLVQGFGRYGIWMRNNSFLCEISSSQLVNNQQAAIFCDVLNRYGRGGDFLPNLISDVTIYGGEIGIEANKAIVLNINDCVFFQTRSYAIYIRNHSNSVLISGCRTFQIEDDAILVEKSHEVNISSNIFCWHRGHGIVLDGAKWGSISSNNIIDSGVRTSDGSLRSGVVLMNETKGFQITSNAIFNWGDQCPMEFGIVEDASCQKNLIASNNINYFKEEGINSEGKDSMVNGNLLEGPHAWVGMERKGYPDFTRDAIEAFIKE
jgi:hypothetical protein